MSLFGFLALQAVILNKAMSLAVAITALPARMVAVPLADIAPHWSIVVNLLAGSLVGAWAGASWATRMRTATLHKVIAALLVLMAAATMHGLLTGQESRQLLYTMLSGGRTANHLYLQVVGDGDPHTVIRPETIVPRERARRQGHMG